MQLISETFEREWKCLYTLPVVGTGVLALLNQMSHQSMRKGGCLLKLKKQRMAATMSDNLVKHIRLDECERYKP